MVGFKNNKVPQLSKKMIDPNLVVIIDNYLVKGFDIEYIKRDLEQNGYLQQNINDSINSVVNAIRNPPISQYGSMRTPRPRNNIFTILGIFAIIFFIMIILAFVVMLFFTGSIPEEDFASGVDVMLEEGKSINFIVDGEKYNIIVSQIGSDNVLIIIGSIEFSLKEGSTKNIDVTGDGVYDVTVGLDGVFGDSAKITINKADIF